MVSSNDFSKGLTIELDGEPCEVLEFQHVKPGKGQAFVRSKLRGLISDRVFNHTFRAGEDIPQAHIEERPMQFLYRNDDRCFFMDTDTYEQTTVLAEDLGDRLRFLKDNMVVSVVFYEERVIDVQLPNFVKLKVTKTEPGFKGDTASNATKPATLESGARVQVPLFIEEGDLVKVDTRSKKYMERV